jgi:uncharacterized protein YbbC (DUF1343 family)
MSERPPVRTGLDRLVSGDAGDHLRESSMGLILHPASVTKDLSMAVDALRDAGYPIRVLFGPQHGARGEKQDNMIESEHYVDPRSGLRVHSLYSDVRRPTAEMLEGLDSLVFDLQDVGVRVYTFIWTMALAMEACAEAGIRFVVLDRPNPVGGIAREGPVLRSGFESFVGMHPIPLRHGMTAGELARWLNQARGIACELEVVPMTGWERDMLWEDTGLPYVLPSPNLPTPQSCQVYPGGVLLEGTNLSEGRGTTRPFELVGAPYLDPHALVEECDPDAWSGARLRACWFEPTFQKHQGVLCGGVQIHVTDPRSFRPVRATVSLLRAVKDLAPGSFDWRPPPYEYEELLMPVDMLWGHSGLRTGIDAGASTAEMLDGVEEECRAFTASVEASLLY